MRTSRISRDTARLLAATRTRPSRPSRSTTDASTRSSASNSRNTPITQETLHDSDTAAIRHDTSQSESGLSSVPDTGSEGEQILAPNKKRKRRQTTSIAVKQEMEETNIAVISSPKKKTSVKKARRTPAKKIKAPDGSVKMEPPPNWEEIYALTREMRNENVAPVDTMGCESLADRNASPRDQRFQTLVALMLSSQTKDTVTSVAIKGMQDNMPGGFSLESVLALEPPALNAFINKVGFHNLKTKYIKQAAEILRDKWNSDIPDTIQGLTSLPGVGPKMAYLCLSAAWGRTEGIGVDVHVHRITNLWGWHNTKQPEETRLALQSWLPKEKWHDINNLLVGFGQTICLPVGRRCGDCKLADRGLCPSAVVAKATKIKQQQVVTKEEDSDGEKTVRKKRTLVINESEIKAEEVDNSVLDIEDIGQTPRRSLRKNR